jgi:hypothetical protein
MMNGFVRAILPSCACTSALTYSCVPVGAHVADFTCLPSTHLRTPPSRDMNYTNCALDVRRVIELSSVLIRSILGPVVA